MKKILLVFLILIAIVIAVSMAWRSWLNSPVFSTLATTSPEVQFQREQKPRDVPPGFSEYRSDTHHFSILYPKELKAQFFDEKNSTITVTFETSSQDKGFQIFATPYNLPQVSQERFAMDVPSGVMLEPTEVLVGGAPAMMFFSTDALMGETREVWFIHNSILYEITTQKANDAWLSQIMKSWEFI